MQRAGVVLRDEADHAAHVDAWLERRAKTLAPAQQVALFEQALGALWRRAEVTLGEITLTAIIDRVLCTASDAYPFLSELKIEETGISFEAFREQQTQNADLCAGLRLVLVEFLTVLGHLTDEILTPALHGELSRLALEGPSAPGGNDDGAQGAST
jgi:hypothetical protein